MNKKKINIILIIVVLSLWGSIIYKTVNQYLFPKQNVQNVHTSTKLININRMTKDTFQMEALSRDPFLNTTSKNTDHSEIRPYPNSFKKNSSPTIKPNKNKIWPDIKYYGYIASKNKKDELVMVAINNKLYKLKKNNEAQGIVLRKVYTDSIELFFNKEKKIVRLNEKFDNKK